MWGRFARRLSWGSARTRWGSPGLPDSSSNMRTRRRVEIGAESLTRLFSFPPPAPDHPGRRTELSHGYRGTRPFSCGAAANPIPSAHQKRRVLHAPLYVIDPASRVLRPTFGPSTHVAQARRGQRLHILCCGLSQQCFFSLRAFSARCLSACLVPMGSGWVAGGPGGHRPIVRKVGEQPKEGQRTAGREARDAVGGSRSGPEGPFDRRNLLS
jgi:hypothetical protein